MTKPRNQQFIPYTITPSILNALVNRSQRLTEYNIQHPKTHQKEEVLKIRASNLLVCQGCKNSLKVNDCVFRYGTKPHICHFDCINNIFVDNDESLITPGSINPSFAGDW